MHDDWEDWPQQWETRLAEREQRDHISFAYRKQNRKWAGVKPRLQRHTSSGILPLLKRLTFHSSKVHNCSKTGTNWGASVQIHKPVRGISYSNRNTPSQDLVRKKKMTNVCLSCNVLCVTLNKVLSIN